jgi:two-component system chemotaxis response regulator CheY
LARKILLADDSVTAQNMGRKILADAGYEVIAVNNGSAALKKIAELKPDIIILDVYMPGYSGLEVCQRLKEAQETSRIPVLLSVGKLEPFKPEEAKRVRAEGYIVKPFEASELLSALSKLEDKIVPRAEPSKPGRFARANAAIDESKHEGRYDKSVAVEEDSGWKNRIGFPSKKKKVEDEQGDDSSIYNAVNKDLRTVVDRSPAHQPNESRGEESRVDLGALTPEGLPKDVTPEEIAALAAAAAQVKGKLAEPVLENLPDLPPEVLLGAKAAAVPVAEPKAEAKAEAAPVAEVPKESEAPAATFAAQKPEEPSHAAAGQPADAVKESVGMPSPAEMMAAIAGLVPEAGKAADASSGNGSGPHATSDPHVSGLVSDQHGKEDRPAVERSADEPVTIAAAAGAGSASVASRWTAVAVALAPEESAMSLEHEMQKAHAAFAAVEAARVTVAAPTPEISSPAVENAGAPETSSPVEAAEPVAPSVLEAAITQTEVAPPELAQIEAEKSISPVSSPSPEVVAAAVREFERVAASFESRSQGQTSAQAEPEPASAHAVGPVSHPVADVSPVAEPVAEPVATPAVSERESAQPETATESAKESTSFTAMEDRKIEESKIDESKHRGPKYDEPKLEEVKHEATLEKAPEVAPPFAAPSEEASAPTLENLESIPRVVAEEPAQPISASSAASHANEPVAAKEPAAGEIKDAAKEPANKESEIAETTAAAWASWRRIRESGDGKGSSAKAAASKEEKEKEKSAAHDGSAMAVAAGAEKSPEEAAASSDESPELASIVDSVLAGMRPKIVEEISRKLGKKK